MCITQEMRSTQFTFRPEDPSVTTGIRTNTLLIRNTSAWVRYFEPLGHDQPLWFLYIIDRQLLKKYDSISAGALIRFIGICTNFVCTWRFNVKKNCFGNLFNCWLSPSDDRANLEHISLCPAASKSCIFNMIGCNTHSTLTLSPSWSKWCLFSYPLKWKK